MKSKEIRQKYLEFFQNQNHVIVDSASLIPENDSSSLFISSGMQPLIPYLLGETHPAGTRLVDSQKSFRSGDIEEVGDNRHNTFFEMLGNWSLGDYFKKEQLPWFFEFLTKTVGLDPNRIYVTVYAGNEKIGVERDTESVDLWKQIFKTVNIDAKDYDNAEAEGMRDGRIFYFGDKKNWWSRSGEPANMPVGEIGGPDSEVFYDLGADLRRHENSQWKDEPCHVNCDCGRFIEIGNSVFIQFIKTKDGFEPLKQKNVDFGGGLERITMVSQGKDNVFETDLFANILAKISELSGKHYRDNMRAFEVIADHLKAACFLMGDDKGVTPSNVDQGYIVRRLIRRAVRYGLDLNINNIGWTKDIAEIVVNDYADIYSELNRNKNFIISEMRKEEEKFQKTLAKGMKEFSISDFRFANEKIISGVDAFRLYQSYGFPIEMTEELAIEKGLKIDRQGFDEELKKHQSLSRTASAGKFKGGLADSSEQTTKLHTTAHLLLAALRQVLGEHVSQKGSNITAERLRFDFCHSAKMTEDELTQVENIVNEIIAQNYPVVCEEMALTEAKAKGATGIFESKYEEQVKAYKIAKDNKIFSYEICGGPHVTNTGILGKFKITKEESSSAGIRRIKAVLE
ncbi:MAG: Alanine-tRNA ligase [Candidatus Falkowbacteria bacterium GW2011_GWC2_38_22]|uniref:alanine--tRNA ligase n=1 Tax=Candidatus Falkowbacteria bacterium GW2011_GWE1_38_31 TaxID=1618638 RepID=A0A0G0JTU8_9BACT|nr:MAG: Alanine-tRNA ligase [Candidatus Falkowbacteria bacterium GW2011_GWF2_38_1205]KKQ62078.1 MAG: Alanine-tRNA ligase [Candidatus Falkowbacteria bacterium GW2011_GWC2_38_22]KKQ64228.1 MAG: Alanine-tRNA ligase [Candidatus Falkowbacteria bacterium GW2011_GWF1_38_22]KKQ66205.1 MAG: Alanine-tRNA ligase [Candidatus Falkowbacteria bacterium GW2011_GWE2_38_254]KKQ70933.1 MAG: Alanine-tRNA ligase [Candidatus Falkowbacteria bacterium GW2011_GWE1_38_31]KKQ73442.1 MAG: Alanine-tRNA ligase [Candidatus 